MDKSENKQHTQLPNKKAEKELDPKDQLIYLCIKSFENGTTKLCCPSLQKIAERSNASIPTIRNSITRLQETGYIEVQKVGRSNHYKFNPYKSFEPFSPEFIKNITDLSFTARSYLAAAQQYMFKDIEGLGKISYSNLELSKKINMPEATIRKCNKELEQKQYLTVLDNASRDLETGCKTDSKIYDLKKLGQAVIWTLLDHEDKLDNHEDRIAKLEKESAAKDRLIEQLLRERQNPTTIEYIM